MLLSKKEEQAYQILKKNRIVVFTIKDLRLLAGLKREEAYNLIKSLKKKEAVVKIGRFFTWHDTEDFITASHIHYPVYVSFWSALNYYGWSDQNPRAIFLATTKYRRTTGSFRFVTIPKKRFFGYIKIGEFSIASREKAIIDALLFPKYSGGIVEIKRCLDNAFEELDKKKLIEYARKVESRAVIRRLGFLLESLGYKKINWLKENIGKGYELLDPSLKKKNIFNKHWLLDVNI